MIHIDGISKRYGSFKALDNLSIQIKKGEFYSLLGPNGAGKTTCINILSNIMKADAGNIQIDGLNIKDNLLEIKKKIGIVPQEIALYEDLTAIENLRFWGKINGVSSGILNAKIEEVLGFMNLKEHQNKLISSYSGGMKRRINIAAALLHDPEILLMDEPTVGIDPQSRLFIYEIFEKLHQEGKTILYTSHNMEEVERLSDRIGIIDHGKLIAEGDMSELQQGLSLNETLKISIVEENDSSLDRASQLLSKNKIDHNLREKQLFIPTKEATHDLVRVLDLFDKQDVKIESIEVRKVNLEMIFLELTGKTLRE